MTDIIDGKMLRKYEIAKKVGKGAYGQVWKVYDKQNKSVCALKKIFDAFRNPIDCQRTYRQIMFLKELKHPCIVRLLNYHPSLHEKDVYLCLEFMESDLSIALKNQFLKDIHKQYIFTQIASAVYYLHSGNLIHRDIKPSNILVNGNCDAKLCDFGLVRSLQKRDHEDLKLTENIATRWYKAPELLLSSNCYGKEIDVWSLGCILAEMFLGRPIFQGNSAFHQLEEIIQLTGKPSSSIKQIIKSQTSLAILESLIVNDKKCLKTLLPDVDPNVINLLEKIFQFNPKDRICIEEILEHPYTHRFREKIGLPKLTEPATIKHDDYRLSVDDYRKLLTGKSSVNIRKQNPEVETPTKPKTIKSQINLNKSKDESKSNTGTPKKTLLRKEKSKKDLLEKEKEKTTILKSENNPVASHKSFNISTTSQNKGKVSLVEKKTPPSRTTKVVSPLMNEIRSPKKNVTPNSKAPNLKVMTYSPKAKVEETSIRSPIQKKDHQPQSPTITQGPKLIKPSINTSGNLVSNKYKISKPDLSPKSNGVMLSPQPNSTSTTQYPKLLSPQNNVKKYGNFPHFSRK